MRPKARGINPLGINGKSEPKPINFIGKAFASIFMRIAHHVVQREEIQSIPLFRPLIVQLSYCHP